MIVVELVDGDANLDSSDPSYDPAQIMSYEEAKNTKGTPYSAVVYSKWVYIGLLLDWLINEWIILFADLKSKRLYMKKSIQWTYSFESYPRDFSYAELIPH